MSGQAPIDTAFGLMLSVCPCSHLLEEGSYTAVRMQSKARARASEFDKKKQFSVVKKYESEPF